MAEDQVRTRASKRRKVAHEDAQSTFSPSTIRNLRSAVKGISGKLFDAEPNAPNAIDSGPVDQSDGDLEKPAEGKLDSFIDSAYQSTSTKDGSVDGNTQPQSGANEEERPATEEGEKDERATFPETLAGVTPKPKRGRPKKSTQEELTPLSTRSSGRERRRPRRFSNEMAEAVESTKPRPTSILTPSKRRKDDQKKFVAFESQEQEEIERQLGFRDVSTSEKKRRKQTKRDASKEETTVTEESAEPVESIHVVGQEIDSSAEAYQETIPQHHEDDDLMLVTQLQEPGMEVDETVTEMGILPDYAQDFRQLCQEKDLETPLTTLKTIVLERLTGKRRAPLIRLEDEYKKVYQVVEQTVVAGEGNSMLILGSRGSGKTAVVESVISRISEDHKEDFHVVRLNGFLQTDDRLALKEVWRQLGHEMNTTDDEDNISSYADTMASLLALLSHPEELSGTESESTAKSVIFVVDEFDLFASHSRQTLLYNLFDIAQARKAPIAVLGISTKVDVVESLEKRVKSRFSHRYVHLPLPKSFTSFSNICQAALIVEEDELMSQIVPDGVSTLKTDSSARLVEGWKQYLQGLWNADDAFTTFLQRIYYRTKSVKGFYTACLLPIAGISMEEIPTGRSFEEATLWAPESKLHMLRGLSDLELSLLIAAARLDLIFGADTVNFNLAYHEYQNVAFQAKIQSCASGAAAVGAGSKIWGRELSLGAWEKLGEYELIIPAIGAAVTAGGVSRAGGGSGTREVSRDGRMFRVDVALEEILPSVPNMSSTMAKWCKEI